MVDYYSAEELTLLGLMWLILIVFIIKNVCDSAILSVLLFWHPLILVLNRMNHL